MSHENLQILKNTTDSLINELIKKNPLLNSIDTKIEPIYARYAGLERDEQTKYIKYLDLLLQNDKVTANLITGCIVGGTAAPIASTLLCELTPITAISTAFCGMFAGMFIGRHFDDKGVVGELKEARKNFIVSKMLCCVQPDDDVKFGMYMAEQTLAKHEDKRTRILNARDARLAQAQAGDTGLRRRA